jgi:Tfp pilus assembly protein PilZ
MSEFFIPLSRVMGLEHTLERGGSAKCTLRRPETTLDAQVTVENDDTTHHIKVEMGDLTSSMTLPRRLATKWQSLRDFLQDLANGRADSAALSEEAIALMEAQDSVDEVLQAGQIAYVISTVNCDRPLGVVVTNDEGEVCAAVTGASKEHLAATLSAKLRPGQAGGEECA